MSESRSDTHVKNINQKSHHSQPPHEAGRLAEFVQKFRFSGFVRPNSTQRSHVTRRSFVDALVRRSWHTRACRPTHVAAAASAQEFRKNRENERNRHSFRPLFSSLHVHTHTHPLGSVLRKYILDCWYVQATHEAHIRTSHRAWVGRWFCEIFDLQMQHFA